MADVRVQHLQDQANLSTLAEKPPVPITLVLIAVVLALSVGSILVRMADAPGVVVSFYRLLFASVIFLPLTIRELRRSRVTPRGIILSLLAGVLLAGHFATWISSLSYTTVAASVSLVSTNPLWLVLMLWVIHRSPPNRRVLGGVLLAVTGALLIGLDGASGTASNAPFGNALAVTGAVFVSGYMLLGRAAQRSGLTVGAYAGLAYLAGALALAPLPALFGQAYFPYPAATFGWLLLLALVPQLVGHTGINFAIRYLDPTVVSTVVLLEPVGAGLLALLVFGEAPGGLTLAGAVVLLAGVVTVNRFAHR